MSASRKEAGVTDSQRPTDALAKAIEEVVGDATRGALVEASGPVRQLPEAVRRVVHESFETHNVRLIPGELVELRDRLELVAERLEKHVAAQSADERVAFAAIAEKGTLAVSQELSRAVVGLTQALSGVNQRFSQVEQALLDRLEKVAEEQAAAAKRGEALAEALTSAQSERARQEREAGERSAALAEQGARQTAALTEQGAQQAAALGKRVEALETALAQASAKQSETTRSLADQLQIAFVRSNEAGWVKTEKAAAADRRAALDDRLAPLGRAMTDVESRLEALSARLELIAPRLEALEPRMESTSLATRAIEARLVAEELARVEQRKAEDNTKGMQWVLLSLWVAAGLGFPLYFLLR